MSYINADDKDHDQNAELAISDGTINRVWKKIVNYIAYKTYGFDLSKTADDIAAEAIEFALKDKRVIWDDTSSSEKHLVCVAKKVAKWCICKEIKKAQRAIVSYTLDIPEKGNDGEQPENHKAEVNYVMKQYREDQGHKKMMELGRLALSRLDCFLSGKGVSKRDIRIYKDRALYGMPTDDACMKHSVMPSNLYKIVCVVNSILATKGRALVRE